MRNFRILFSHELLGLAIALPTYVAAAVFLGLTGTMYWLVLYLNASAGGGGDLTPVQEWFSIFWVPLLVIVPQITMRSFAGESRAGTLGALFSTPVRPVQVVCAKFAAAYCFHLLLWVLALLFPVIAWWLLRGPHGGAGLLPLPALLGGFVFVASGSSLYIATGLLASSLTRSTLVAALLTLCALLALLTGGSLLQQHIPPGLHDTSESLLACAAYLDTFKHRDLFLRGIVDTRPLFLFATGTMLALSLTTLAVKTKA